MILAIFIIHFLAFFALVTYALIKERKGTLDEKKFLNIFITVASFFVGWMMTVILLWSSTPSESEAKEDYAAATTYAYYINNNQATDFDTYCEYVNKIKRVNDFVAESKRLHNNIWVGYMYSDEIAKLEPIDVKYPCYEDTIPNP